MPVVLPEQDEITETHMSIPGEVTAPLMSSIVLTKHGEISKIYSAIAVSVIHGFARKSYKIMHEDVEDVYLDVDISDDRRVTLNREPDLPILIAVADLRRL
jgi:hypothetical protein